LDILHVPHIANPVYSVQITKSVSKHN